MTLIEILLVIALIGTMALVMVPRMASVTKVSMSASNREIAASAKEAYNAAVMTGKVHRIVYDLKESKYWVEMGPNSHLLDTEESKEREKRRERFKKITDDDEPKESSAFSLARVINRKKRSLPRGVSFEDILTEASPEPITSGLAYTHFFPHGIAEQTLIHLKDLAKNQSSLVILPITGQTKLFARRIDKKEAFLSE